MGKEIQKIAAEEHRTVSELIRETFRQYKAQSAYFSKKDSSSRQKERIKGRRFWWSF